MYKFNVGDKVKLIKHGNIAYEPCINSIGIVTKVSECNVIWVKWNYNCRTNRKNISSLRNKTDTEWAISGYCLRLLKEDNNAVRNRNKRR